MSQISKEEWSKHQEFEKNWHGNCLHTLTEELKQVAYAQKMGLTPEWSGGQWPWFNFEGKSVIDIGGGPSSMLLKGYNLSYSTVVDPCDYPEWVINRYALGNISFCKLPAEEFEMSVKYDLALCYNVLQHTIDPEKIINNMREGAKQIRLFEWVDMPPVEGHPHELTADNLRKWLKTDGGERGYINEHGAVGYYFAGVFDV